MINTEAEKYTGLSPAVEPTLLKDKLNQMEYCCPIL